MTGPVTLLPLARVEGAQLAQLIDEFLVLVSDTVPGTDPGLSRLTPDAYPGDPDASAAFAQATRTDLLGRRHADAGVVRAALEHFTAEPDDAEDAFTPVDLVIPANEMDAWLRTLSAMRLVIASRLGITDEDDHEDDDPRYAVYDWLGYRLDGLVRSVSDLKD